MPQLSSFLWLLERGICPLLAEGEVTSSGIQAVGLALVTVDFVASWATTPPTLSTQKTTTQAKGATGEVDGCLTALAWLVATPFLYPWLLMTTPCVWIVVEWSRSEQSSGASVVLRCVLFAAVGRGGVKCSNTTEHAAPSVRRRSQGDRLTVHPGCWGRSALRSSRLPFSTSSSSSSSHARWQGATRWKRGWYCAWKGRDDSSATTPPTSEQVFDWLVMTALHVMQDHLQQTTVIPQALTENAL